MNQKNKIFGVFVVMALLLSGCGNSQKNHKKQTHYNLFGKVADGYIVGAKVCLDVNQNGICDPNEPSTVTLKNGKFSFTQLTDKQINSPIILEVTKHSIDTDDNKTTQIPYIMLAPAKSNFISPLTTLIAYKMQLGSTLITAMIDVSKHTGASLLYIDGNFMRSDSLSAKKTRFVAKIIAKTTQLVAKRLIMQNIIPSITSNINATRYINQEIFNHSKIIKTFLSSISNKNIKTKKVHIDAIINKLTQTIISNLSNYKIKIKAINIKIQKIKDKNLQYKINHHADKTVHTKSDAKNIGAIIFVLSLQLFFFIFLAFFL